MRDIYLHGFLLTIGGAILVAGFTNCASSDGGGGGSAPAAAAVNASQANVMAVTVGCGYENEPCVTVTVCVPGTTQCQVIPNVLLDTGSFGLRLFNQISLDGFHTATSLITLPKISDPANSSNVLTECMSYDDGSSQWGPLAHADVKLGGEAAVTVPIQVVNSTFGTVPASCTGVEQSAINSGFNGILGVGLFQDDCGPGCAPGTSGSASNNIYFSCPSSGSGSCTGVAVAESLQVTNPVSQLAVDNNGVILELPSVPISFGLANGATSADGYLVLGIGTSSNNIPSGTKSFAADGNGNFKTIFNGVTWSTSFIDSGSNALYFPAPAGLPTCTDTPSFYCPTSEKSYTAVQEGSDGQSSQSVAFQIGNSDDDSSSSNPNFIFADLGGSMSSDFDWGLPFFFGRNVYVGIYGKSSSLGAGPLWAY